MLHRAGRWRPIRLALTADVRRHNLAATVVAAFGDKSVYVIQRDTRLVVHDCRRATQEIGVHFHHTVAALALLLDTDAVKDGHHPVDLYRSVFHDLLTDSLKYDCDDFLKIAIESWESVAKGSQVHSLIDADHFRDPRPRRQAPAPFSSQYHADEGRPVATNEVLMINVEYQMCGPCAVAGMRR